MIDEISKDSETKDPRVFISYSRADLDEAEKISAELTKRGHVVSRDRDDILPTEEWKGRLEKLITEADVVVFLLSPKSAASDICRWEVEFAQSLNKKLAPIVIKDVEGAAIPEMSSRLNYMFANSKSRFENAVSSLSDAISADIEWIREHTRLTNIALDFKKNGEKKDHLLTQSELDSARHWAGRKPASITSIASNVLELIERSQEHLSRCNRYTSIRLRALTDMVDPLLKREIQSLTEEMQDSKAHMTSGSARRLDSSEGEFRQRIAALQNFTSKGEGRWHPLPAEWVKTASALEDYAEVYRFPCCGEYTYMPNTGTPPQFGADGCEADPTG